MTIIITIPGKPFAKQRPRISGFGGKARAYTPKETVSFERSVGTITMQHFNEPLKRAVRVDVLATFKPAKSWSNKKTAAHLGRYHTQKPDADNLMKAVLDGMNKIAFVDDSQVAEQFARKVWGPNEQTVIIVTPLDAEEILNV